MDIGGEGIEEGIKSEWAAAGATLKLRQKSER